MNFNAFRALHAILINEVGEETIVLCSECDYRDKAVKEKVDMEGSLEYIIKLIEEMFARLSAGV